MRLGCLFAFISFIALSLGLSLVAWTAEVISQGRLTANPEGIGSLTTLIFLLFGPYIFIRGYRKQKKAEKEQEVPRIEDLRPLKLDGLKDTLTKLDQDSTSKLPPRD